MAAFAACCPCGISFPNSDIDWLESKITELLEGAFVDVEKVFIYSFANEAADHAPHRAPGSIIDKLAVLVTSTVLNGKEEEFIERYCPVQADGNEPFGSSSSVRLADINLNNEYERIADGLVSELIEHVKIGEEFLTRGDRAPDIPNITKSNMQL